MDKARFVAVLAMFGLVIGLIAPPAWADEANAEPDEPTLAETIDEWFGDYVTAPLWNYFIAVPLFRSEAVEVHHAADEAAAEEAADLLRQEGEIVAWVVEPASQTDAYAVTVRVSKRDEAVALLQANELEAVEDGARSRQGGVPFIVLVLLAGGLFFTLRYGLVHMRLFGHAWVCISGRYDDPRDKGDVSHVQALSAALSATVGLGNIAGVAIAIAVGGPGAVFWMWVSGFLGMSMKFAECTLSQVYRRFDSEGRVLGGPMVVMEDGLGSRGGAWKPVAKIMGVAFAIFIMCAAFGVALFQTKTSYEISADVIPPLAGQGVAWGFGLAIAILVGIVIIGGMPRIGRVAARLVPAMCVFYIAVCLVIVLMNITQAPRWIAAIFTEAFTGQAVFGGFVGVLIMGIRRGMFSNEAGVGSAPIAHAAARTREPVREGLVAMLGPFIDTIVICTMTALAILCMGVHETTDTTDWVEATILTARAFADVHIVLAWFLVVAVLVFAYSTLISWSYYGDRGIEYLLGERAVKPFRLVFVLLVLVGPLLAVENIVAFADVTFFAAALPNIVAAVLLSGAVAKLLKDYQSRLRSGAIRPVEAGEPASEAGVEREA